MGHTFGSLGFTSPLSPPFLVALATSFCLLNKNYTVYGMDQGQLRKIIPFCLRNAATPGRS